MFSNERNSTYWRLRAEELRARARRMRHPATKRALASVANRCDAIAREVSAEA